MIITLPKTKQYDIPGCEPFIINRSDITNKKAWYLLTQKNTPYLNVSDFVDFDVFTKYYLVTTGLLDYSMSLVYGNEGGGKSLVMSWLAMQVSMLFGKRCVLDWTPPHPEYFGDYYDFNDDDFSTRIQGEIKVLEKVERKAKALGKQLAPEAYKKLVIYNSFFALDEGDSYADKLNVTNLTKLIARVIRRRRHYHTCMAIAFVDPRDAPTRLIGGRSSHEIECSKDLNRRGWCVYTILTTKTTQNAKAGTKKLLHLNPADLTMIWDSYNAVGISHDQYIYLGGKKNKGGNDYGNYGIENNDINKEYITKSSDNKEIKFTKKQIDGIVAWKDKDIYKLIYPPYGSNDIYKSLIPIDGIEYADDIKSATKSMVARYGKIPKEIRAKMGVADIRIVESEDIVIEEINNIFNNVYSISK